ncbi:UDP-N-acetylmuramoyl-tripeptide--D-alanyl-D-alanine ligase [Stella humosa]|uniref:UDP-N-acetylmuramoyl-tripeptide--D-alanyl-D-alanine ligase n=1 Tax=Stella humosa TaxID=94 RepID=A0A3N1KU59_9PROT|nr:UDP-N-acetylmuramoylalanyl-D-glutamyl-2,6-diaminopimelate--D-alanyl-D-alanine ligase [Stella humosa]ROP84111.1 UDP-N-acetylmuramoyl-tripeptide--D-alanyl-D-alanine ligase [Stella humosa]BBK33622.1 UDP-N-acetylmuramoyl-tripeptide--D-alanyl-D-alanine ligase [Stella humosa]
MTALWTAAEIALAVGSVPAGTWTVDGVSIDSRTMKPGDLFVALKGPSFDGHAFVADVLARGAAGALVDHAPEGLAGDPRLVVVGDTLDALTALGRAGRDRTRATVVAVTGSVGKTGTKELLRLGLEAQGSTIASAASLNNHWGLPLSLARVPRDIDWVVQEVGMNHAGEIAALTRIARPHVGVITTVGPVHIEFFPSVEAIADAKSELFLGMMADGAAVLNRDNPHFERMAGHARDRGITRILDFGTTPGVFAHLEDAELGETGSAVRATVDGRPVAYRLGAPGRHWVLNSLAALAAISALGADVERAAAALASVSAPVGRGARHEIALPGGGGFTLLDESYNANPASMRAAFSVLAATRPAPGGRRIAVLGDMRELGETGPRLHAALADPLIAAGIDIVFCCGSLMAHLHASLPTAMRGALVATSDDLAPIVADAVRAGDVVTVKGSLGTRMAPIVKRLSGGPWGGRPQAAAS